MKTALWFLAPLLLAQAAHAQNVIEWSRERRLVREDFQGRAPTGATKFSMSWLNVDASWECKGGQLSLVVLRATFDPARSWWRTTTGSAWAGVDPSSGIDRIQSDVRRGADGRERQLLDHEQLHFDLAEVAVRKLRSRFDELKAACADPDGEAALHEEVVKADRDLQQEQARFDAETSHGSNGLVQAQWGALVRQQLDQLSRPPAPAQPRRR
jgi:hypothetical protein